LSLCAGLLTSLGRAKVLAGSGSTRTRTTGLLNAQGSAFNDLTLKTLLGGISLLSSDHLDEAEATGLLGVGIEHNLALLDIAILLKETSDLLLREARMDTCHEEVGSRVDGSIIRGGATIVLRGTTERVLGDFLCERQRGVYLPAVGMAITTGRGRTASSMGTLIATSRAWGCAAITLTLIARAVVYASRFKVSFKGSWAERVCNK
jgi:hypothetical protein